MTDRNEIFVVVAVARSRLAPLLQVGHVAFEVRFHFQDCGACYSRCRDEALDPRVAFAGMTARSEIFVVVAVARSRLTPLLQVGHVAFEVRFHFRGCEVCYSRCCDEALDPRVAFAAMTARSEIFLVVAMARSRLAPLLQGGHVAFA